jgi:hypothetical protein
LADCWVFVVNHLDADRLLGFLSRSSAAAAVPKRSARARHFVSRAHGQRAPNCYFRLCVCRTEADTEASCLRLEDSKEGESIRPIGLPVVEYLEQRRTDDVGTYVFPGQGEDNAFGSFPIAS